MKARKSKTGLSLKASRERNSLIRNLRGMYHQAARVEYLLGANGIMTRNQIHTAKIRVEVTYINTCIDNILRALGAETEADRAVARRKELETYLGENKLK